MAFEGEKALLGNLGTARKMISGQKTVTAYQQAMQKLGSGDRGGAVSLVDSPESMAVVNQLIQNYDQNKKKTQETNLRMSVEAGDAESAFKYGLPRNAGNIMMLDRNLIKLVNETEEAKKKKETATHAHQVEQAMSGKPASAGLRKPLEEYGVLDPNEPINMYNASQMHIKYSKELLEQSRTKRDSRRSDISERRLDMQSKPKIYRPYKQPSALDTEEQLVKIYKARYPYQQISFEKFKEQMGQTHGKAKEVFKKPNAKHLKYLEDHPEFADKFKSKFGFIPK